MLNYKPELYVEYVIDLFTTGKARIGSLEVKPGTACRAYQPPKDKIAGVDWVALASLGTPTTRSSTWPRSTTT